MSTSTSTRRRTTRRPSLQSLSVARSLPVDSDAAAAPRAHFSRAVGPTKKKKSSSVGTWPYPRSNQIINRYSDLKADTHFTVQLLILVLQRKHVLGRRISKFLSAGALALFP